MGCTFSVASAASEPAAPFTGPSRLHSSPPTKAMDVIELVARARRGERTAWSTLLERYQPLVRAVARGYRINDAVRGGHDLDIPAVVVLARPSKVHASGPDPAWLYGRCGSGCDPR